MERPMPEAEATFSSPLAEVTEQKAPEKVEREKRRQELSEFATEVIETIYDPETRQSSIDYITQHQGVGEHRAEEILFEQFTSPEQEPDESKRILADVLLAAPQAFADQFEKDRIIADHHGSKPPRGTDDRAEVDRLVEALTGFDHEIRKLIDTDPYTFTRDDLESWLSEVNHLSSGTLENRNQGIIRDIVAGIVAETAVYRILERSEYTGKIYRASLEEEKKGIDIVATLEDGREVKFDIKSRGDDWVRIDNDHYIVPVNREDTVNFDFTLKAQTEFMRQFKQEFPKTQE